MTYTPRGDDEAFVHFDAADRPLAALRIQGGKSTEPGFNSGDKRSDSEYSRDGAAFSASAAAWSTDSITSRRALATIARAPSGGTTKATSECSDDDGNNMHVGGGMVYEGDVVEAGLGKKRRTITCECACDGCEGNNGEDAHGELAVGV